MRFKVRTIGTVGALTTFMQTRGSNSLLFEGRKCRHKNAIVFGERVEHKKVFTNDFFTND